MLWLATAIDDRWVAREARKGSTSPVLQGAKSFTTGNASVGIAIAADVECMWYGACGGPRQAFDFAFATAYAEERLARVSACTGSSGKAPNAASNCLTATDGGRVATHVTPPAPDGNAALELGET